MSKLVITGQNTTIIHQLVKVILDHGAACELIRYQTPRHLTGLATDYGDLPRKADRYVFAHGFMQSAHLLEQVRNEIDSSLNANLMASVQMTEIILANNPKARICIVGSASGINGSYDTTYALAKAALHKYVEWRRVGPDQQLVAVAPSAIEDSGMTQRRALADLARLRAQAEGDPKGRLLTAMEVARAIYFLLWQDLGFITNHVLVMDGGKNATMKGPKNG